jgi:hypothetical protein
LQKSRRKKSRKSQDATVLKKVENQNLVVYNGFGTYDKDGNVKYSISLPKEAENEIKIDQSEIFNIKDETIFIRMDNGKKDPLENPNNDTLHWTFKIPHFVNTKKEYKIFVYHDDAKVDEKQAEIIINSNPLLNPKKIGKGILSFQ